MCINDQNKVKPLHPLRKRGDQSPKNRHKKPDKTRAKVLNIITLVLENPINGKCNRLETQTKQQPIQEKTPEYIPQI